MRHFSHFLTKAYETKSTRTNEFALFILRESDPIFFNRGVPAACRLLRVAGGPKISDNISNGWANQRFRRRVSEL